MSKFRFPLFHPYGASFDKLRMSGIILTTIYLPYTPQLAAHETTETIIEQQAILETIKNNTKSIEPHVANDQVTNSEITKPAHPELVEGRPVGVEKRKENNSTPENTLSDEAQKELEAMIASGNFAQIIDFQHTGPQQQFYNNYLSPYYPRACVIGGFHFTSLPLADVDKAIADIVKMFKDEPWFYFVDKPEHFNQTRYWEYIVDQLAIIHEFLVRLKVDPTTQKVFNPAQGTPPTAKKAKYLLDYLLDEYSNAVGESIALTYDYINKLFLDAIKREDIKDAIKYLAELEYLEENLRITRFERDYHEHMTNVVHSLFELLKKRQNISDEEIDALRTDKKPGKFSGYAGQY